MFTTGLITFFVLVVMAMWNEVDYSNTIGLRVVIKLMAASIMWPNELPSVQFDSDFNSNSSSQSPEVGSGDTVISEFKVSVELLQFSDDAFQTSVVALVQVEASVASADTRVESWNE